MLKYVGYDIVFREIPDEVTLAINLSLCPNRCKGCHSACLRGDIGDVLDEEALNGMLGKYEGEVTCVSFMGGDGDPQRVAQLARHVKRRYGAEMATAWYSGNESFPEGFDQEAFDYVKIGPYIPEFGPLDKRTTNQRLYRMKADGSREDITSRFWER